MSKQICFKHNGVELSLCDYLTFVDEGFEKDDGFYSSFVGEKFRAGVCDKVTLKVCQHEWLEIYFEVHLYKNGELLTNKDYYSNTEDQNDEIWSQDADYRFAMYLVNKGATVNNQLEEL